jgi:hypothetical protein
MPPAGASSSTIVRIARGLAPSTAPPVGVDSVSRTLSLPSTAVSLRIVTVKLFVVSPGQVRRYQLFRITMRWLRARCALVAFSGEDHRRGKAGQLLRDAERHAGKLLHERIPFGVACGCAVRAGVAAARGRVEEAVALLVEAEQRFTTAEMGLHAAAARRRRGELLGGAEGAALIAAADAWMSEHGIKNAARMAASLLPGRSIGGR